MSETTPFSAIEHRRRRALYRATHRGTKELDWLIGRFAEDRVPAMGDAAMDVFERFLSVPDPDLHTWIFEPARLDQSDFSDVVHDLRAFHKMAPA